MGHAILTFMAERMLIVTHHAPDLDAICAAWLLVRFESQKFASAQFAFVNPGERIRLAEAAQLGFELHEVVHVDTGLGKYDHHQPDRGKQFISATSLVHDHILSIHPEHEQDEALQILVNFVTDTDHFGEIYWPEADHDRYCFMLHELIKGIENSTPHDDESMLYFGMQCLDSVYSVITQKVKAKSILDDTGIKFNLPIGDCIAVETRNDDTIKVAQKRGYMLVIKKDPKLGNIRIKARPDAAIDLKALHDAIIAEDHEGTWYYHPSGKMLLNGSDKARHQAPSPLTLERVLTLTKEQYGVRS